MDSGSEFHSEETAGSSFQESYRDYRLEDRSVAMTAIPGWVFGMMLGLLALPAVVFWAVWPAKTYFDSSWSWLVWSLILMILHESTHAVAWKLASGLPWKRFTFGIQWKTLTPYCHSLAPMPVKAYRIGAITPLIVTGLLPWFVSLTMGRFDLAVASALLISGASGDIYILWSLRDLPQGVLVQDHDTKAGCVVLWPAL